MSAIVNTSRHIIVIEDNSFQRLALLDVLSLCGYRVTAFENGALALNGLQAIKREDVVDLILCDIVMPEMDGLELLDRLKDDEELADIPVIMMSANDDVNIISLCIEKGAKDYLVKPIQLQIVRSFHKYFGSRKSQKEGEADMYERLETIGRGAAGSVHMIRRLRDSEIFAHKEIRTDIMNDHEKEVAGNEVTLLKLLNGPTIIKYHDSWTSEDSINIVMEHAEGGSLYKRIKETREVGGKFSNDQIMKWMGQIVLGMVCMHSRNILHRDMKSENIFLTKDDVAKIGDFGIAKSLTATGAMAKTSVGTPYFMSPELCRGESYGQKSDMWALGCILYELCTLNRPFAGNSMQELFQAITQQDPPPLPDHIHPTVRLITYWLLQKDAGHRPTIWDLSRSRSVQEVICRFIVETNSEEQVKGFYGIHQTPMEPTFPPWILPGGPPHSSGCITGGLPPSQQAGMMALMMGLGAGEANAGGAADGAGAAASGAAPAQGGSPNQPASAPPSHEKEKETGEQPRKGPIILEKPQSDGQQGAAKGKPPQNRIVNAGGDSATQQASKPETKQDTRQTPQVVQESSSKGNREGGKKIGEAQEEGMLSDSKLVSPMQYVKGLFKTELASGKFPLPFLESVCFAARSALFPLRRAFKKTRGFFGPQRLVVPSEEILEWVAENVDDLEGRGAAKSCCAQMVSAGLMRSVDSVSTEIFGGPPGADCEMALMEFAQGSVDASLNWAPFSDSSASSSSSQQQKESKEKEKEKDPVGLSRRLVVLLSELLRVGAEDREGGPLNFAGDDGDSDSEDEGDQGRQASAEVTGTLAERLCHVDSWGSRKLVPPEVLDSDVYKLRESENFRQFAYEARRLRNVDLGTMTSAERKTFFLNVAQALLRHSQIENGYASRLTAANSLAASLSWPFWFDEVKKATYAIGGFTFSFCDIKNLIMRRNRKPFLCLWPVGMEGDPRIKLMSKDVDPRVTLFLNDPPMCTPLHAFTLEGTTECLNKFTKYLLQANCRFTTSAIRLPLAFRKYQVDFGSDPLQTVQWVLSNIEVDREAKFFLKRKLQEGGNLKFLYAPSRFS
uniref:non-specific serine/threonine protein kinase n=1 Tax=Chromera velia CCMP2878 TaxID=1169474 RepID=A0A0G4IE20_9ALVE|eukprot:Cvel_13471.t1-p1 / transcript=Cvel_13471.t1 / gene=Cvel_13471 / organism=Chromera_velia_CCMP2878 / gene_product=Serine/threonine-protein kinase Nek1, putative / transcript_product=Serine/threonine-protein kinase Nek1, putative / location=Cvel_scaffold921:41822-52065(+) / protein_length=1070 / sequence_SO=supercontig / SO=protein_coding / is_pseudo=false